MAAAFRANADVIPCVAMRRFFPLLLLLSVFLLASPRAASVQSPPAITPQSLAGDWEYVLNPPLKMVLHLRVDATGAMSGTVDTPDTPPKHLELTNVHLAGNQLIYTMPSLGTIREVVMADGKKMAGPYMWERAIKVSVPPQQLAGDWTSDGPNVGGTILHLRIDPKGTWTGTLDVMGLAPSRQSLSNINFDGNSLSFAGANGSVFHGTLGNGGKTLSGSFTQSGILITWQQTRNAAQAVLADNQEKPRATDGAWNGVMNYTAKYPNIPLRKGSFRLTFHFGSNPASCSATLTGDAPGSDETVPCEMTLTGNSVHVDKIHGFSATFIGTLSADARHLSGVWTMGDPNFHWTGPSQVELTRSGN
jgi:hypothetical protein